MRETGIKRNKDRQIGHAHRHIKDFANRFRKPRTHLQHVGFIGTENTDRAPGFVTAQICVVRIVLGSLEVVAQNRFGILDSYFLFRREIHGEVASLLRILRECGIEHLLDNPNTRVVINAISPVIACVGLGKIKFSVRFRFV